MSNSSEKEEAFTVRDRPRRHLRSETDYDSYIEDSDEMEERSKTRTEESVEELKPKKIKNQHPSGCDPKLAKNQKLRGINWMVKETQKSGKLGKSNTMRSMSKIIEDKGMKDSMFKSDHSCEDHQGSQAKNMRSVF